MKDTLIKGLEERFKSYRDIIDDNNDAELVKKLDQPKTKSLLEHLWCVVGARESYAKALCHGKWDGFKCSMSSYSQTDFIGSLEASANKVLLVLEEVDDWTEERGELLLSLYEHEVMHEGQIIRLLYASRMNCV